jgi:O-antigen/teichoic acid export membrane protein
LSIGKLASEGVWVTLGTIISGALGYAFLILMSKFVSPDILGSFGAVLALQSIVVGILNFGMQRGTQRFIGEAWGRQEYGRMWKYLLTSLLFASIITTVTALTVLILSVSDVSIANLNPEEQVFLSLLLVVSGGPSLLLGSLYYSVQKTKILALSQILGSSLKIVLGIALVLLWPDFVALVMAYVIGSVAANIVLIIRLFDIRRELGVGNSLQSARSRFLLGFAELRGLMHASFASWVPEALRVLGDAIGLLGIYAVMGSVSAGIYFVAFAIASVVYIIPGTILGIMMPMLSAMQDGRKRMSSRAIQLALIVSVPISMLLILYAQPILSVIGREYSEGSVLLQLLLLGAIVASISRGYVNYIYVQNRYKHIAIIGAVISGSQLLCYSVLIPAIGEVGAAISYSLGFFVSLVAVFISSRMTGFRIDWSGNGKSIAIPGMIAMTLYILGVHWSIGAPLLLFGSLLSYTRLKLLTADDIAEVLRSLASEKIISRLAPYSVPVMKVLYGRTQTN